MRPIGPFRIVRTKLQTGKLPYHNVYFEDADGLDHHFFPYAERHRRSGGWEPFFDFTFRATIKPRMTEAWTYDEIGMAIWETEYYRMAKARTLHGVAQSYSIASAVPHPDEDGILIRTRWTRVSPPFSVLADAYPELPLSLFLPEPTYQQNVLPRAEDEWMLDELDALVTEP
jgi:hypothetical protein